MTAGKYPDKKLANLIIAGVNKAGSTSLFHYLSAHPEVCGSIDKETCYFLPVLYNQPLPPISEYESQFRNCHSGTYRMEATPGYVTGGEKMAAQISETLGEVKIIIILKEPVDRLVSFYKRKKATLQLPQEMSFREYVERCTQMTPQELSQRENHLYSALKTGEYDTFLEPWLERFKTTLKIVFFDDLKQNPEKFMTGLASWLKIDSSYYSGFDFDIKNKSINYKNRFLQQMAVSVNRAGKHFWRSNPGFKKNLMGLYYKLNGADFSKDDIDPATLNFLKDFYRPHLLHLESMLSRYGINEKPSWLSPVTVPA